MRFRHWFAALLDGAIGVQTVHGSRSWRRRRIREACTSERLESRVLLSAVAPTEGDVVTAVAGTEVSLNELPTRRTASGQADASVTAADDAFFAGEVLGDEPGPDSDGGLAFPGGDTGGEIGGTELTGGDPGGELGGVDISGDGGGDTGGDTGGEVGGIEIGGDVGGETGGDIGGGPEGGGSVSINTVVPEAWEGPYHELRQDEGRVRLQRTAEAQVDAVTLKLGGDADPDEYRLSTDFTDWLPPDANNRVTVQFAPNAHQLTIFVQALQDGDWEVPEDVVLRIESVEGNAAIGASREATVTILDQQIDLDITSHGEDGPLDEDREDNPGTNLLRNNDFDAGASIPDAEWYTLNLQNDRIDAELFAAEDDFAELTLTDHFQWPNDLEVPANVDVSLDFDALRIRIWLLEEASAEHQDAIRILPGVAIPITGAYLVEGLGAGTGTIAVHWQSRLDPEQSNRSDVVTETVWDIDLDIDSDNNDGLDRPGRTDWEETLEDNLYGIGKLIFPTPLPLDNSYDGQVFTPLDLTFAPAAAHGGFTLELPGPQGESGYIRIWVLPSDGADTLRAWPLEQGGHLLTSGYIYTPEMLPEGNGSGWTFWISAEVAQTAHSTKAGAERQKPDDRVSLTALAADPEGNWTELKTDDVKYMVTEHPDTFYPNLQWDKPARYWDQDDIHTGQVLRDSLASAAIYALEDLPQFGLQLISETHMEELGIDTDTILKIIEANSDGTNGLAVGIYRDYLSPEGRGYILTFAGTHLEVNDILTDIVQGLGLQGSAWHDDLVQDQYNTAMMIGRGFSRALSDPNNLRELLPRMTGHSLGGGLASAASVAGPEFQTPATTFNAAGLHKNTLTLRVEGVLQEGIPRYQESFEQFARELAGVGVIKAFITRYDLLNFLQDTLPPLPFVGSVPRTIGERIHLDAPYDPGLPASAAMFAFKLNGAPDRVPGELWIAYFIRYKAWLLDLLGDSTNVVPRMARRHSLHYCHYGLMVQRMPYSNIRTWDIFGFTLPDE